MWLKRNMGEEAFWTKEFGPPNSPNLNPLDFWAWAAPEEVTNTRCQPSLEALRNKILEVWDTVLNRDKIKKVCDAVVARCQKSVAAVRLHYM